MRTHEQPANGWPAGALLTPLENDDIELVIGGPVSAENSDQKCLIVSCEQLFCDEQIFGRGRVILCRS